MLRHIRLLAILIEMVYLYVWASCTTAKFAGMHHKLKFYQKKSAERLKKLRKLIVDSYVMCNADYFSISVPFPIPVYGYYIFGLHQSESGIHCYI